MALLSSLDIARYYGWFTLRRVDGAVRALGDGVGDAVAWRLLDLTSRFYARPEGASTVEHLLRSSHRRQSFVTYRDLGTPREAAFWREYVEPAGLVDQLRVAVFDKGSLVAWVGMVRTRGSPEFGPHVVRALNPLVKPLTRIFATTGPPAPFARDASFVCDERGRVLHACDAGQRWLEASRTLRDQLRAVTAYHRDTRREPGWFVEGAVADVLALGGDRGRAFLVRLREGLPLRTDPWAALPPRQRRLCELVAEGLTTSEAAGVLGIRHETARSHLRLAYAKLGVSSRLELVRSARESASAV